jgi:hypothetical protein
VFENRVLRKVFGPKSDKVRGDWRRWHSEGFYDLYPLPSIRRITKARRIRWVGRVARMRKEILAKDFRG